MALTAKSLIVYNLEITPENSSLDFKASSGGSELQGTLALGFYSVTSLAQELARVLNATDPANIYTVTVNRSVLGGTQNRITITTDGTFLSLLFSTGTRAASTIASLIGFNTADYTGNTTYTGSTSVGTTLIPDYIGYNYSDPSQQAKVFGSVNVSAAGVKESVVFNIQKFLNIRFKYESAVRLAEWKAFFYWAIQQRPFDFTPEITNPNTFYQVTLERTQADGKGLGFLLIEMLPQFPDFYDTGNLYLRQIEDNATFI